jgi:predicted RNA-binding protein associated with RNAse of E/G family
MEFLDELVFRSDRMIVGKSHVTSENSVIFDGKTVLARGFPIIYFQFFDRWFTVVKIRNLQGEHTGYYCDIVLPPRLLGEWVEITDLFLDLWVSPDLQYTILDEDEFEEALQKGWITKRLCKKARTELHRLVQTVENGKFPPTQVKELETKLGL